MLISSPGSFAKRHRQLLLASLISGAFYLPVVQANPPPVRPSENVGLQEDGSIVLPDSQVIEPAGHQITVIGRPGVIAIRPDHKTAVVINGDGNTGFSAGPIVIFDLVKGTVLQQHVLSPALKFPTNSSDGTNILVNPATGAASTGSVSGIDLASGAVKYTIQVGLEPTALVLHDNMLFVANTNSDTISVIDPKAGTLAYTFP